MQELQELYNFTVTAKDLNNNGENYSFTFLESYNLLMLTKIVRGKRIYVIPFNDCIIDDNCIIGNQILDNIGNVYVKMEILDDKNLHFEYEYNCETLFNDTIRLNKVETKLNGNIVKIFDSKTII